MLRTPSAPGPLSTLIFVGAVPRWNVKRSITVATTSPFMPWSAWIARHSRVNASTTLAPGTAFH